jgi:tRNA pseudouridine55 synthase
LINGFLVIDKPAGITSHDVVSRVRRILGTRKVGHTGTLDPFATGVLPVAVNDGTKVIPFLDEGRKRYEALMRLGVTTDTLDITGTVLREADSQEITRDQLEAVMTRFTGNISQIPPMFSAIKQNGQPLYKLAREGKTVERQARQVQIHSLELLEFTPPLAAITIVSSRGTYIRTLADDIGNDLGCGAVLQELRRSASGPFDIATALTLEELEKAVEEGRGEEITITPFAALANLIDLPLSLAGIQKVKHGISPVWELIEADERPVVCSEPVLVRLSHEGVLVAVAQLLPQYPALPKITLKRVFI